MTDLRAFVAGLTEDQKNELREILKRPRGRPRSRDGDGVSATDRLRAAQEERGELIGHSNGRYRKARKQGGPKIAIFGPRSDSASALTSTHRNSKREYQK